MDPAWSDPLSRITIPRHPSISEETIESDCNSTLSLGTIESDNESTLSSVYDDAEYAFELKERATKVLDQYEQVENTDDTKELLSAFVENLPLRGQLVLMTEINDHADNPEKLRQLRNFLVDAILKPMKVAGGHSPQATPSTAPEYEDAVNTSMVEIEPSVREQKRLRRECMKRDGYQCVATGLLDPNYFEQLPKSARGGRLNARLECSHILPCALGAFNEHNALQVRKKTTIWWALYRYFPGLLSRDVLQAGTINRHENAITLQSMIHEYFGAFDFALEPLDEGHKYRSHIYVEGSFAATIIPNVVTLIQHDTDTGQSVPMPNPDLLRVHCIVAKILHLSGLGDLIDATLTDSQISLFDSIAPDGSTDLGHALSTAMLTRI